MTLGRILSRVAVTGIGGTCCFAAYDRTFAGSMRKYSYFDRHWLKAHRFYNNKYANQFLKTFLSELVSPNILVKSLYIGEFLPT